MKTIREERARTGSAPLLGADGKGRIPGRWNIAFEEGTPRDEVDAFEEAVRAEGRGVRGVVHDRMSVISLDMGSDDVRELDSIRRDARVLFVEADKKTRALAPDGWDRVDERSLPTDNLFDPPLVFPNSPPGKGKQMKETGKGVHVYVIDTGIFADNSFFDGRVAAGDDEFGNTDGRFDCFGHGTNVAGVIGADIFGGAPEATLVPVRVMGCSNDEGTSFDLYQGIYWVKHNYVSPAVANISIIVSDGSLLVDLETKNLLEAGVTVAIAAGNDGVDACNGSPAKEGSGLGIVVGATDPNTDARWDDGPLGASNIGSCVDIFAPGVGIATTTNDPQLEQGSGTGTSLAAPHVAAVAALYLQSNPSASPLKVRSNILHVATTGVVTDRGAGSPDRLLYLYLPADDGDNGWTVGDFNGDGKDDILRHIGGYTGADMFLAASGRFERDGSWTTNGQGTLGWIVGDFNGDGRDDLLRKLSTGANQVLLSDGTKFLAPVTWLSTTESGVDGWHVGDFNGDGKDDIFRHRYSSGEKTEVFLSNGALFVSAGNWSTLDDGEDGFYVGRVNSDNRSDIFRYKAGEYGAQVQISSGISFALQANNIWTMAGHGDTGWLVGDFTGDGRDDLLRTISGTGTQVIPSTGTSFAGLSTWTTFLPGAEGWYVGDFNGNGRQDVFRTSPDFKGAEVLLSTGTSFALQSGDWTALQRQ